jgi:hypothetical protein
MTAMVANGQSETSTSESVRTAERELGERPVVAAAFAAVVLQLHPEYANGRGQALVEPFAAAGGRHGRSQDARTTKGWLDAIRALIDQDASPRLNGRLVLLGLALLDDQIFQLLHGRSALEPLVAEIVIANERRPQAETREE